MIPVAIVGAGPGAPDLLTIRAKRHLEQAEVLVWTDSLIPLSIANLAPKGCERVPTSSLTLEEIIPLLISRYRKGKKVVRLHDGDPSLYGAISEQICGLTEAEVEVEVVPGISAYQATAASLKSELTIPGLVQTIILSRAGGRTGVPKSEELENLASLGATLCLYLSARHVEEVEKVLLRYYSPQTKVAIGYRVSWEDEWLQVVSLDQMASTSKSRNLIRTTLYIISPALNEYEKRSMLYAPKHDHLFRPKDKPIEENTPEI